MICRHPHLCLNSHVLDKTHRLWLFVEIPVNKIIRTSLTPNENKKEIKNKMKIMCYCITLIELITFRGFSQAAAMKDEGG